MKRAAWSKMEWGLIKNHRIAVGVSEKLVRCAWGEPVSVKTRTASHEVIKTMVYEKGYVHINNDIVTTIQTSRNY